MREFAAQLQQLAEGETPLPTATGGTWFKSLLRTMSPERTKHSTLGPLTGQLAARMNGGGQKRQAVWAAGLVGILSVGSLGISFPRGAIRSLLRPPTLRWRLIGLRLCRPHLLGYRNQCRRARNLPSARRLPAIPQMQKESGCQPMRLRPR